MDLFDQLTNREFNLLGFDGIANYFGSIVDVATADVYLKALTEQINWQHDQAVIYGKSIITKRKVGWYGERAFAYTYSGVTKTALPWNNTLKQIKLKVENESGISFNSCLLNYYLDGSQAMAWHSDGETDLVKNGVIASLSFGAERRFVFKHKQTKTKRTILLQHGSLLLMRGETQTHWLHSLPPSKKITTPRINLTFRQISIR